ncbi:MULTISPECIES: META domain-containing protein [unclassified Zymobacter]|uniref:META domain-containing protein n=1 Tax=unclassified Zymobacter TaxID=3048685 RepID=UPI0039C1EAA6
MMKRSVVILGMAALLAGCGHSKTESDNTPPTLNDAVNNHVFELKEVDGKAIDSREVGAPSLSFVRNDDGSLRIAGQMCNSFSGSAKLDGQVLTAPMLAMTRRLCADDQLNALDHDIGTMLEKGATVEYGRGKLTLKANAKTLVYFIKVGSAAEEKPAASGGHH